MLRDLFVRSVVAGTLLGTLAVACTGSESPTLTTTSTRSKAPTTGATSSSSSQTQTPSQSIPRTFDPKNFTDKPTDVNRWLPMVPGIQSVRKGYVNVGGRRIPHIRVTTITDVTKMIDGVRAVLVLDQDFDGEQLAEQAIDYLAEDVGGNVWYVGAYTEVYEGGQFLNAEDAWLAGVNGTPAGLYFPAKPKVGAPPFYQTKIPGGEQSIAEVVKVDQETCVPFKCYTGVVVIQEGGSENKYWAPGVGGILTEPLSGGAQETEELVNITQLSAKALAELSAEVLKLDRHASVTVPSVFGGSDPAKRGL